jgi:hypothetical protein
MDHKRIVLGTCAAVLAAAMACSKQAQTPVSPSAAGTGAPDAAAPDGSTLKATAPTPVSPVNGQQPDALVLTATKSEGKFAAVPLQYEFEIYNAGNQRVYASGPVNVSTDGNNISFTPSATLVFDQPHTWKVRAVYNGAGSPWSANASFKSPAGGYIRGNEMFEPATNGPSTIMSASNDVTWLPGVGVRLNSRDSFVEYRLQQPCTDCELSAMITNLGNGSEEWKTKVLSMLRGDGVNVTDNNYRLTLDKRTTWVGQGSVIRYTLRSRGVDAGEPKSSPQSWNRNNTYFWQYTWAGGQARLRVLDGGRNGTVKADLPTTYKAPYSPDPHLVRMGSVGGRGGNDTNPGTIIWNLWVSPNPRPNLPGDK